MNLIEEAARKIESMEVRGAARIARFAAETLREYAENVKTNFDEEMRKASERLMNTRPTAVSLFNAINYVMNYSGESDQEKRESLIRRAEEFIEWVDTAREKIGRIGAKRIMDGSTIMTHCNSSAALSVIKHAFDEGKDIRVFATESRPRHQGYLTTRELADYGIDVTLIVDSAVRYFMKEVDVVVVGADTITVNGALINKIGTSQIALAAKEARVPFMVAAETYKFSPKTLLGELVVIEERDVREVIDGDLLEHPNVTVRNPAFDVTPRDYIDLIITEIGAIPPEMAYIVIRDHLGYREFGGEEITLSARHYD
ncbi:ribose 1,5-bisphosphate isomerase [Geoglobus acetivorans]|uniref:Ribose 1,5-bisphosphate isomerase n=1 Tax=Geoglobus acetivorans TaxID=565033 RepID=A0A0A7GH17_GEOAI|nr:ribose 1,5-bisphosphate isomerase [Geoglobus acetivorans]